MMVFLLVYNNSTLLQLLFANEEVRYGTLLIGNSIVTNALQIVNLNILVLQLNSNYFIINGGV